MSDLFRITIDDEIAEVHREIQMRLRVYPGWITRGKIAATQAERHIEAMKAVLRRLKKIKEGAGA